MEFIGALQKSRVWWVKVHTEPKTRNLKPAVRITALLPGQTSRHLKAVLQRGLWSMRHGGNSVIGYRFLGKIFVLLSLSPNP